MTQINEDEMANQPPAASDPDEVAPYSVLSVGYDAVMAHVEYDIWAEYIHEFIQRFLPGAQSVLELGCGTGTFAFELLNLYPYTYTGMDRSPDMIRVAQRKAAMEQAPQHFFVGDFTRFTVDQTMDVALLLYDGLNYVLEEEGVVGLLESTYRALKPGGIFLFDQSTPANSLNNQRYFEDEDEQDGFVYRRKSSYDKNQRLHTTTFDITVNGRAYHETHVQRAYAKEEIERLIGTSPFSIQAAFSDFSTLPATRKSERIHWVLRKQA